MAPLARRIAASHQPYRSSGDEFVLTVALADDDPKARRNVLLHVTLRGAEDFLKALAR